MSEYISISMGVRVFTVLLCYTPILGLFDTNYHGSLGKITTARTSTSYI
jgi:hypothetical protein